MLCKTRAAQFKSVCLTVRRAAKMANTATADYGAADGMKSIFFALAAAGNVEFLAVLRDGAARDVDAFSLQARDDFLVAERVLLIFALHHLADLQHDGAV